MNMAVGSSIRLDVAEAAAVASSLASAADVRGVEQEEDALLPEEAFAFLPFFLFFFDLLLVLDDDDDDDDGDGSSADGGSISE